MEVHCRHAAISEPPDPQHPDLIIQIRINRQFITAFVCAVMQQHKALVDHTVHKNAAAKISTIYSLHFPPHYPKIIANFVTDSYDRWVQAIDNGNFRN
jgi:hypothetical protein